MPPMETLKRWGRTSFTLVVSEGFAFLGTMDEQATKSPMRAQIAKVAGFKVGDLLLAKR